ncbi:hypothetical protein [Campylobacter vulpis]|uniref:Uncharacterized protein n=1 Tax=Campylobacter vulpis TaxID=1655500 RepID=A0ABS5P432_9BACT|nr:hypothetical protein [Campylobacter vulpis]MBS4241434.1 hypothetical protein [Campylobacter vulpis]MBS4252892.1 hypothetical protein [Campylobacter vulpis]MBS4282220.1 hypothetical protein [Campylobacter vulpis]MBS4330110.1 hypothetical protein [Campylobacter vulpis]
MAMRGLNLVAKSYLAKKALYFSLNPSSKIQKSQLVMSDLQTREMLILHTFYAVFLSFLQTYFTI